MFDEVWEGAYHLAPMAHAWHGYLDNVLAELLGPYARRAGLIGTGPFNLGEPDDFRVPDRGYHRTLGCDGSGPLVRRTSTLMAASFSGSLSATSRHASSGLTDLGAVVVAERYATRRMLTFDGPH